MKIALIPILTALPILGFAQDGTVDITFGSSGISSYTPTAGNIYNDINKTVVLPDNRILQCFSVYNAATSSYDFALARYNSDGQLDVTFDGDSGNDNGIVLTDFGADEVATALALQQDGKIVVVGYKITGGFPGGPGQFAIARYNSNGTLDQSFDGDSGTGNGKFTTTIGTDDAAYSVAVNATRIVVAGYAYTAAAQSDMAVAVYNISDGILDNTFNSTGKKTTAISGALDIAYCVRIMPDSKIVLAGFSSDFVTQEVALVRYTTTGNLDTGFDSDGIVTTSIGAGGFDGAYEITMLPAGKILAVGSSYNGTSNDFAMLSYTAAGALDVSFNGTGIKTYSFGSGDDIAYSALVQSDGKIIVAGTTDNGTDNDFAIARFNSSGTLDNTFNSGAIIPIVAGTNVIDFGGDDFGYAIRNQNSKIIFGGITGISTAMTRLNNSGTYLPVRLLSFSAKKEGTLVDLNWQTSMEENSSHFEIERSSDGKQFVKIGSLAASFNSQSEKNYEFKDVQPLHPANYYRLKMVDVNGKFIYSNVLVVKMEMKQGASIFPNPTKGIINLQVSDAASLHVRVTDAVGRTVKTYYWNNTQGSFNTVIDLSALTNGIYFIKLNEEIIRFIKE